MPVIFQKYAINDLSLGEILKLQRQEQNLDLNAASKSTDIKIEYLQALESGDYEKLPNGVYGKNFLKRYCSFLSLKHRHLLPLYERESEFAGQDINEKKIFSRQCVKKRYFFLLPKLWRNIILMSVISAGFVFIGYSIKEIVAPPHLEIFFPPPNYKIAGNEVEISGKIEKDARLFINDAEVIIKESGDFNEVIKLKTGMNVITVRAQKKYGQDLAVKRQILVE